jgi:hypothetical protein
MIRRLLSRWRLWRRARINIARRKEAVRTGQPIWSGE